MRSGTWARVAKVLVPVVMVMLLVLPAAGCGTKHEGQPDNRTTWPKGVSIGSASVGGTYYVTAGAWAKLIMDQMGISASVEVTGGALQNIQLVDDKETTFGLATNGPVYEAWNGLGWTKGTKYSNIRAILPMNSSHIHFATLESTGIRSVHDLDGRVVGTGPKGGTTDVLGRAVLDILGVKPAKIVNLAMTDLNDQLRDGMIDAYWNMAGAPMASFIELETTNRARIFAFTAEEAQKVKEAVPYVIIGTIPQGTYKTQEGDLITISGFNLMLCHRDLPEDFVYELIKATYEHQDVLIAAHETGKDMPPERIAESPCPLHVGAVKYFAEKGVKLPDSVMPPEMKK